jgi:hypothetical protein
MILSLSIVCVLTLLVEEVFFRSSGLRLTDRLILPGPSGDGTGERDGLLNRRFRAVKLIQFTAFGILWMAAGGTAGRSLMTSSFGQITTQLFLMQILRTLGRQIVRNRTFLTVMGIQQAFLALTVPLLVPAGSAADVEVHPVNWLSGAVLAIALLALAVAFSATVVYFLRLSPRFDRGRLSDLPPLASSERLVRRTFLYSIPCLLTASGLMLIPPGGIHFEAALAIGITLLPAPFAIILYLDRRRLHHPAANLLAAVGYPLLLGLVLSGLTAMG